MRMRYIFAGAERVRDETRRTYAEKFGLRILEGYGATEAGPVIAVNTPMHFQAGSVGRLLPGIEARLDPVPGIDEGGRLSIRGPNIMAGYLKADAPGDAAAARGRLARHRRHRHHRRGRLRHHPRPRQALRQDRRRDGLAARGRRLCRGALAARPTMPSSPGADPRKGEQLVLFTTAEGAERGGAAGLGPAPTASPNSPCRATSASLEALPVLGTGKIDYVALGELAKDKDASAAPVAA